MNMVRENEKKLSGKFPKCCELIEMNSDSQGKPLSSYSISTWCSGLTCLAPPSWCCCPCPMVSLLKGIIFMVVFFMEYQRDFQVAQIMPLS